MKVAVIVPVCDAAKWLPIFLPALQDQQPTPNAVLFIDSASDDSTADLIRAAGFAVHSITRRDFNHGGTRRLATELVDADIYVFLTQDALLHSHDAVAKLVSPFTQLADIGISYGRQLPHHNGQPLGTHARLFNYPTTSQSRSLDDAAVLGVKTCFSSDSFCAYRRKALQEIGGFPHCVIGTEDAYIAGRMLIAGWKVHYAADACVRHSHDYTLLQQFRRYFDIGVFYGREKWLADQFGSAGSEGLRFVRSEIAYLVQQGATQLIPYALLQNVAKMAGYRLGKLEKRLPAYLKKTISMNSNFWRQDHTN